MSASVEHVIRLYPPVMDRHIGTPPREQAGDFMQMPNDPLQAVAKLAELAPRLEAANAALATAKANLDSAAMEMADAELLAIAEASQALAKAFTDAEIKAVRAKTIIRAAASGLTPAAVKRIAESRIVSRNATITLPSGRFENKSRGRGYCRKGTGSSAVWGERERTGYVVKETGGWVVGHTDGFSRKAEDKWIVETVGNFWIAN